MVFHATPRLATLGPRLRNAVLVLFALFAAHDAIYLAQYGLGAGFTRALSDGGHDGYWAPARLAIGVAGAAILLGAIRLLGRLELRAARTAREQSPGASYLAELAATWLRLFPTVGLLFAFQENVERYLVDGHVAGLDVLFGTGASLVVPVLATTTFVLAALGSLVRWRIHVLEARIAATRRHTFERVQVARRPGEWVTIAAALAHRWILDRRDAGRAPPHILSRFVVVTA